MSLDLALPQGWSEALGWTLLLALCQTTLLALVVRGLFHRAGRPTAVGRYRLAWTALWSGAGLWAASVAMTLVLFGFGNATRHSLGTLAGLSAAPGGARPTAAMSSVVGVTAEAALGQRVFPALTWLWLAVTAGLLARLAGGWILLRQISTLQEVAGNLARRDNGSAHASMQSLNCHALVLSWTKR